MELFNNSLSTGSTLLLFACVLLVLAFEFVNGFHDTANAVATVIYTSSLKPRVAVVLSGIFNFIGVMVGGIAVAMAIIKLLPVELLVGKGAGVGLAMSLSLLLGAIMWNVGTWYIGLPASSSHTMIGSILGVGVANSLTPGHAFGEGVNWAKALEMGKSLLISPLCGFAAAGLLYYVMKRYARNRALVEAPPKNTPPPLGTRVVLIGTCSAVSFAHGSNDGQKGVGLMMLILIGLLPAGFALDMSANTARTYDAVVAIDKVLVEHADVAGAQQVTAVRARLDDLKMRLGGHRDISEIPEADRFPIRADILLLDKDLTKLVADGDIGLSSGEREALDKRRKELRGVTDYAPLWVILAIAIALGLGTMVGWKRIVVTIGEKIGKAHLTYGQGMSAELVAATAIGVASTAGLPVSTTHVLSSGIAGTMVAQGAGVESKTVRKIALAWVFTLPATMVLSGTLFLLLRMLLA
ncbi:MAG: inorganic phosphate transporter [Deltaproteobacteria bacterium]|nr:inorganic phosphate transporter [Deltaproteobacteria bacterium]MCW5804075.1 inorganic phosphate transporter [Deltaproteobacteria bacterium]